MQLYFPITAYYNDEQNKTLSGNFVAVRIQAPDEYESSIPDTAVYRKSISEGSEDSKAWFFWNLDVNASNSMNSASDYYDDNSGTGSNFSKKVSMNAGQTIQVLIGRGSGNGNLTTTVYVEKFEEMASIPLTLNESSPLNVETGTYQWYSFKALADGDYIFYSDYNDGDPKAWFFNDTSVGGEASVETLNSACQSDGYGSDDDDSDKIMGIGNTNFAKKISMRQGQTVYIAVGHYSLNGSVTASIHVIQSNE